MESEFRQRPRIGKAMPGGVFSFESKMESFQEEEAAIAGYQAELSQFQNPNG
jgi:hypothetical protein